MHIAWLIYLTGIAAALINTFTPKINTSHLAAELLDPESYRDLYSAA